MMNQTMQARIFGSVLPVALLLGAGLAIGGCATAVVTQRDDCPGKIVCPQTGELVCKDQCPLGAQGEEKQVSMVYSQDRDDCPGMVVCPKTGELVCKDLCPLEQRVDGERVAALPACCR